MREIIGNIEINNRIPITADDGCIVSFASYPVVVRIVEKIIA